MTFNAFLLRLYFDGNDEIAWHTDGRTFLGEEPTIASLSLGCKATFQLRRMNNVWPCADGSKSTEGCVDASTPVESFVLTDGDLLVMRGKTQKYWHHRVPREKGRGVRLNINFRYVLPGVDAERGQRTYYKYMVYGDCPVDREPPGWTFDEIMAKKGGMMNFVRRSAGSKIVSHDCKIKVEETKQRQIAISKPSMSADVNENKQICIDLDQTGSACSPKESHGKLPPTIENNRTSASNDRKPSQNNNYNHSKDVDMQQYLASDPTVDLTIFFALPSEIREELISQWKSQQSTSKPPNASAWHVATISPLPSKMLANGKRKLNIGKKSSSGTTTKKTSKGTLDSFFVKK